MDKVTKFLGLPIATAGYESFRQNVVQAFQMLDRMALPGSAEILQTSDAGATAVSLACYESIVSTGGSGGSESLTIGDGSGVTVGHRKLITCEAITESGDEIALDHANFSQGSDSITGIVLDAAGEFILAEWRGASWEVIVASSGVVAVE